MDGASQKKPLLFLAVFLGIFCIAVSEASLAAGYFQLHNLMSSAQKVIPSNTLFNDAKLSLENEEKGSGHVVNTQFSNDGGMAGCGITSTLMQYMYQNSGSVNLSNNYIALNVYSQIMGFNPDAPFWGDPEGQVKGYLTQGSSATNVAYPYIPYHRQIPSLYPAYEGLWNNGLNCGRWVQANFSTTNCLDRTSATGISKSCPTEPLLSYAGESFQGYVFDSCEDNNGWCRDDAAHIDINPRAFSKPDNYYLQWKFIRNPYYSDSKAVASLKDIWLAWFNQASPYWSYIAILNAENGVSSVQYNVGSLLSPTWIESHVLGGNNDITWASTSNNGQIWQVEPVNALTDSGPSGNPLYQMRFKDYLGYPANHGAIYQFNLLFQDGTLGQAVGSFSLFYEGGAAVKSGNQRQNMTLLSRPSGTGRITVAFGSLLPAMVSLTPGAANYLRPVLVSSEGYSWDAAQCQNNKCVFIGLPLSGTYHVFAHAMDEQSNDLTLRRVNDISISSANITFPAGSTLLTYTLKASDMNLSTLYSARVVVPLKFATTSTQPVNGNLQALFVPDSSRNAANISASTQGCFLNTYINAMTNPAYYGNNTTCTVYYTVNHQTAFTDVPPPASFKVVLPTSIGFSPVNYVLSAPWSASVQITGYHPANNALPTAVTVPLASYAPSSSATRSMFWILDPDSDSSCLQNLDPIKGVTLSLSDGSTVTLTTPGWPVQTQLSSGISSLKGIANRKSGADGLTCTAMSALVVDSKNLLKPGIDVVDVIKLETVPASAPPAPATEGVLATATGDSLCTGASDTLTFSSNGTVAGTATWVVSANATKVNVSVAPGTYGIADTAYAVPGGTCKLTGAPSVTISANTYTPVSLPYTFTSSPLTNCTVAVNIEASWPGGCTIGFSLKNSVPLSNVFLSWPKGSWNWANAQPWGGEGSLAVPAGSTGNVIWALPVWVNAQGSSVGMNVNNDGTPSLCSGFAPGGGITVSCGGTAS